MTSSAGVQIPALPLAVGARPGHAVAGRRPTATPRTIRPGRGRSPRPDVPAQLLSFAVLLLPEYRQPWGAAMTAELTEVRRPAARRRFAAGCIRATWAQPASTALLLAATLAGFRWLALRTPLRLVEDRLASGIAIGALTIAAG